MTSEHVIIFLYIVGVIPVHGFLQDANCVRWVRIPTVLFWPITIPLFTVLGLLLRAYEDWRDA